MKRFASSGARICALGLGALAMAPATALAAAPGAADPAATAWILSASALVLLMTLPGLALFYGGLVREKNVLSVLMQCVAIACVCTVLWLAVGYSLAFSGTAGFIGDLNKVFLGADPRAALVGSLPEPVFFLFQTTFAIITPALIIGAVVERARFAAVLLFSGLWLLAVYAPVTHWIWGGGWLAKLGIMDYAGGLVVHATAGVSALVFAISAVSIPMLLDRPTCSVWTAIATSFVAVRENWKPMALWAALIVAFTAFGMVPFFLGLVVTLPLIGHATWHAYKDLVVDGES